MAPIFDWERIFFSLVGWSPECFVLFLGIVLCFANGSQQRRRAWLIGSALMIIMINSILSMSFFSFAIGFLEDWIGNIQWQVLIVRLIFSLAPSTAILMIVWAALYAHPSHEDRDND